MASFTDDFNRANSTDLGAGWVQVSGFWSIVSSQLSPGSDGGTIILRAAGPMDSNDHSAQVTIAATTAASHGVWCRGNSGISNGYLWRNDGSEWTLFSVVSSTFTAIGSYAAAAAPGDVAKIQAVGSTIKGYVNGVERVSVTDTAVASGTSVGLRSTSASAIRFDDFAAADVTAGVALTAAAETDAAQALAGGKTATLSTTLESEAAQALPAMASQNVSPADSSESAQPLTSTKTATLGVAVESSTARSLAEQNSTDALGATVGPPHGLWAAGHAQTSVWAAGTPRT